MPALGEHNETLLRDLLGLAAEEYEALIEDGVVCDRPPEESLRRQVRMAWLQGHGNVLRGRRVKRDT